MALSAEEYPYIDVEDYLALDNTVRSVRYEYIDLPHLQARKSNTSAMHRSAIPLTEIYEKTSLE